ncbi:MAG: DUF2452 domain-containing protein [Halieaceae bacterium]
MKTNPNPQGKGLVPVLDAWKSVQPEEVAPKSAPRLLADYLVSLLVLSAEFSFKPVPGNPYYLYWQHGQWQLSLISPREWGHRQPGECLGECLLGFDMTWHLVAETGLAMSEELQDEIKQFTAMFGEQLASNEPLEDTLPFYVRQLPFYRRLLATGLATSLQSSIRSGGQLGHSGRSWLQEAAADMPQLLPEALSAVE